MCLDMCTCMCMYMSSQVYLYNTFHTAGIDSICFTIKSKIYVLCALMFMCTCICVGLCVHVHVCVLFICMCTCKCMCMFVDVYAPVHVCLCACVCICVCVWACVFWLHWRSGILSYDVTRWHGEALSSWKMSLPLFTLWSLTNDNHTEDRPEPLWKLHTWKKEEGEKKTLAWGGKLPCV